MVRDNGAAGPHAPNPMPAPTTVCLFIPHLAIGGAELQLPPPRPQLPGAGIRPVIATLESRDTVAEDLRAEGIPVHLLPRRGASGVDTIRALARLVRTEGAEVLHAWLFVSNWRAPLVRLLAPRTKVLMSI